MNAPGSPVPTRKKHSVVFVLPHLSSGGAEKAILRTAVVLKAAGHSVQCVVFEDRDSSTRHEVPSGISVHSLNRPGQAFSSGWLGKRVLAWRLRRWARPKCAKGTVYVSTLPLADEVLSMSGLTPRVHRIANHLSAQVAKLSSPQPAKAQRRVARYRQLYGQSTLIAVSQGVADDLISTLSVPAANVHVIHNPIASGQVRYQAGLGASDIPAFAYWVHAGRFNAQKRHDVLLRAWTQVREGVHLVLLTPPHEELAGLIQKLGLTDRVHVLGFRSNPYPYMAAARGLVLSSDHEGMPNVLVESLMLGVPVVSTDCPSGPAELLKAERPQALVPVGDADALARAVNAVDAAPYDTLLKSLDAFDVSGVAAQWSTLLEKVR